MQNTRSLNLSSLFCILLCSASYMSMFLRFKGQGALYIYYAIGVNHNMWGNGRGFSSLKLDLKMNRTY